MSRTARPAHSQAPPTPLVTASSALCMLHAPLALPLATPPRSDTSITPGTLNLYSLDPEIAQRAEVLAPSLVT